MHCIQRSHMYSRVYLTNKIIMIIHRKHLFGREAYLWLFIILWSLWSARATLTREQTEVWDCQLAPVSSFHQISTLTWSPFSVFWCLESRALGCRRPVSLPPHRSRVRRHRRGQNHCLHCYYLCTLRKHKKYNYSVSSNNTCNLNE